MAAFRRLICHLNVMQSERLLAGSWQLADILTYPHMLRDISIEDLTDKSCVLM